MPAGVPGARFVRAGVEAHLYLFAGGYVVAWALFSVAATIAQRLLARLLLLSPMMELTNPGAAAALLILAGAYQLTPLKRVCLRSCRSPVSFLLGHWRPGRLGRSAWASTTASCAWAAAGR